MIQVQIMRFDAFLGRHNDYWQSITTSENFNNQIFPKDGHFESVDNAQNWIDAFKKLIPNKHRWRIVRIIVIKEV